MSTQLTQAKALANFHPYTHVYRAVSQYQWQVLRVALLITDALMLMAAFRTAYFFRFDLHLALSPEVTPVIEYYLSIAIIVTPVCLALFAAGGLYDRENLLGGTLEYSKVLNCTTLAVLALIVVKFALPGFAIARGWVLGGWFLSFIFVSAGRFLIRRIAYGMRVKGYFLLRTAIVGMNPEATALADELSNWRASGVLVVGHVTTPDQAVDRVPSEQVLGTLDEIEDLLAEHRIEQLIVAITALRREQLLTLCETVNPLKDLSLRLSSGLFEVLTTGVRVKNFGCVPCISLEKIRLNPGERAAKYVLDYALALAGLVILSPLFLLLGLLVRLDSPGPILHRRRVLGVGGRTFDAFKFRTMHVNGDEILARNPELLEELQRNQKLKNDPRVTRLGAFLRSTSLDELPQLLNVLLGQMSLVGPRMISPEEAEKYGRSRMNLLTVRPGITGLWQVSGRSELTYDERVRLDIHYIRYYSVWRDLQILFVQTLPSVLKKRGAY
ncbi:MAG: sugar transferase [Acidobacteriota bacterium]